MLVLSRTTRPEDNEIYIDIDGKRLRVLVVEIRGDKCRLGFEAPAEFRIRRGEILDEGERAA